MYKNTVYLKAVYLKYGGHWHIFNAELGHHWRKATKLNDIGA